MISFYEGVLIAPPSMYTLRLKDIQTFLVNHIKEDVEITNWFFFNFDQRQLSVYDKYRQNICSVAWHLSDNDQNNRNVICGCSLKFLCIVSITWPAEDLIWPEPYNPTRHMTQKDPIWGELWLRLALLS